MKNVRYEFLSIDQLKIAPEYQREVSKSHIKKITDNFDPTILGTIVVSYRDGKYFIIDGQHRVLACKAKGVQGIFATVLDGLTFEEEAEKFNHYNLERKSLTAQESFKSMLAANDQIAVAIETVLQTRGFATAQSKQDGKVAAVTACRKIVNEYGVRHFKRVIDIIADAWDGKSVSLTTYFLSGISDFVKIYGSEPNYGDSKFSKQLSKFEPKQLLREMKSDTTTTSTKVKRLNTLLKYYNHNLVKKLDNVHFSMR